MSEAEPTAPPPTEDAIRVRAEDLRAAFATAERWLAANRDGINAINVYPVPDGDTGTNLLLTLRAALRAIEDPPPSVGEAAERFARAALLGARGNSGVILSQMLRGFAEALDQHEEASDADLIHALRTASDVAYAAVSTPIEGTMLTVLREASDRARDALAAGLSGGAVFHALTEEAYASVQRTPTLLPRLAEAGVVDAGGAGIAVILEGIASHIQGAPLPAEPRFRADDQIVSTGAVEHDGYGYCTEYLVVAAPGQAVDRAAVEAGLVAIGGESLLVVGDALTVHVHVHVEDPGAALSIGARAGTLDGVKVENMQAQHEAWLAAQEPVDGEGSTTSDPRQPIGLVAIASGEGIARAFRDLGASVVLQPRAGAKTSAAEILDAARRAGNVAAIVLPNDADVLMVAEAAAREAPDFITVVPSRNVATGLAAAIYFTTAGDAAEIAEEMSGALSEARSIEVATASRDASMDGVAVRTGDPIVFVDGHLRSAATSHEDALLAGIAAVVTPASEIVTVYLGRDAAEGAGAAIPPRIMAAHPGLEVEVLPGGQPHYVYLASVE